MGQQSEDKMDPELKLTLSEHRREIDQKIREIRDYL